MAEIHPVREQSEPDPAGVEPNSPGGSSAIPGSAVKPFRRSQRVRFEMPVGIYISRADEKPAFEEGKTLTVNAHGALLAFSTPVGMGQTLRLVNPRTRKEIECRVCRFGLRYPGGVTQVGVEFVAVAPAFWDVAARPPDWDPAWVPPAERMHPEPSLTDIGEPNTNLYTPQELAGSAMSGSTKATARRSTRLSVEISVVVHGHDKSKVAFSASGKTVSVNVNGALLAVAGAFKMGQSLLLANSKTGNEIACRVRSIQDDESGVKHVGVEYAVASPRFWGISFPPEDWEAADRELPQRPLATRAATLKPSPKGPAGHSLTPMQKIIEEAHQERQESINASEAKIKSKGWRWPVIGVAACVALIIMWTSVRRPTEGSSAALQNSAPAGVAATDADIIPRLEGSKLATTEDFDPDAVSWLRGSGQQVTGEIPGAFTAFGQSKAYVLVGKDAMWRIVILADGKLRCDAKYRSVAIVARVPKGAIQNITWANPPPADSEGDGLLVVRDASELRSGVVLLLRGDEVVTGTPTSYQQIPLSQLP